MNVKIISKDKICRINVKYVEYVLYIDVYDIRYIIKNIRDRILQLVDVLMQYYKIM